MSATLLDQTMESQRLAKEASNPADTIDSTQAHAGRVAAASRATTARPVRFMLAGGAATLAQLATLSMLIRLGWEEVPANAAALLFSTQLNFLFSATFTWRDSWNVARENTWRQRAQLIIQRWLRFMAAISATLALNEALYSVAQRVMQPLLAAVLVSAAVAVVNFALIDRFIFARARRVQPGTPSALVPARKERTS